jgi:hypothetical protein
MRGLGYYEGRGWPGFHHHGTLAIAAYGFLISEKERIPPLRTTFRRSNRKISPSQWLSTPRHPRSGRSATSPTRSARSVASWPPRLQTDFRDARTVCAAFAAVRDGIYDTVVLTALIGDGADMRMSVRKAPRSDGARSEAQPITAGAAGCCRTMCNCHNCRRIFELDARQNGCPVFPEMTRELMRRVHRANAIEPGL